VHQGGVGTLSQAMRAGRPQLITPVSFDQPDNANRAKSLGLGRVLPFNKVTPEKLAFEINELLSDSASHYHKAARKIADELAGTDGAAFAAEKLIGCLKKSKSRNRIEMLTKLIKIL